VLVLAFDPVTESMPGPAIRAWHLAEEVSQDCEVVLASTSAATRHHPSMEVRHVTGSELDDLVVWADAIFAPTSVVRRHASVASAGKPLCIDMYIPTHLENLEPFGDARSADHHQAVAHQVAVINEDLRRGDFFLCASERQRDFWLGSLASLGRVNPETYGQDPTLRDLIDVVPFGVPNGAPSRRGPGLRDAFPAIGPSDPVIIWGGGVYNWFDPLSLVRAVRDLSSTVPGVRLVFLGMRNPNPDIPEMRVAAELRGLSDDLGLTDTHVFFNEGWVSYDSRATYLLDADIGVSTHLDHLETRFSFRTRVLDYLWAGLPMVLTAGDTLSEDIEKHGFAITVPPGDVEAIAAALSDLIRNPLDRDGVRRYGEQFGWERSAGPLVRFCRSPRRAADWVTAHTGTEGPLPVQVAPVDADHERGRPIWRRAMKVKRMVRQLAGRIKRRIAR
jgi:hypothetical protein